MLNLKLSTRTQQLGQADLRLGQNERAGLARPHGQSLPLHPAVRVLPALHPPHPLPVTSV